MSRSRSSGNAWREILEEVIEQKNIIHQLQENEFRKSQEQHESVKDAPDLHAPPTSTPNAAGNNKRRLLSPSPDTTPKNESLSQPLDRSLSRRHSTTIKMLVEALSTSSWSSDDEEGAGSQQAQVPSPQPDTSTQNFFMNAFALVEKEYQDRQTIMLEERIVFTEICSRYLNCCFGTSGSLL